MVAMNALIIGNPGVTHSVPTAFIKAVGTEFVTPGLPRMERTANEKETKTKMRSQLYIYLLYPGGLSHTDTSNKDWIALYIYLRGQRSAFPD